MSLILNLPRSRGLLVSESRARGVLPNQGSQGDPLRGRLKPGPFCVDALVLGKFSSNFSSYFVS